MLYRVRYYLVDFCLYLWSQDRNQDDLVQGCLSKSGLLIFWLTKVWLRTFSVTNQFKQQILCCKKCTLLVTCQPKQWNLALKNHSSFDSPRYDCVLFVSLIRLNGESFAAKTVHFLSLVNVNSENLALKNHSSSDSPRYDWVLFVSLIRLNCENWWIMFHPLLHKGLNDNMRTFLVTHQGKRRTLCCENWWIMFHPLLHKGLNDNSRTFLVTRQGKWRTVCCENWWIMFHPLRAKW